MRGFDMKNVKRDWTTQMIYDMLHTNVTDKALAARLKKPLAKIQRYRLAVDRFYNGAEKAK
jgi:hypothetical protein